MFVSYFSEEWGVRAVLGNVQCTEEQQKADPEGLLWCSLRQLENKNEISKISIYFYCWGFQT